jgi:transglutaminase-like putative cysteine protease
MTYEFGQVTPMIAILNVHSSRVSDLERPDYLITTPSVPVEGYRDSFGNWCNRLAPLGWARVQTICDYVHDHITFGYEHSRATRTAVEAFEEKHGVCRDYAHLALTFCRCLNIPARYCTGYISDIGLPPPHAPQDFAAWIEVFLGGRWHTFDPRNNDPRIGRILIARGRDAADVPLTLTFGPGTLVDFRVTTEEVVGSGF